MRACELSIGLLSYCIGTDHVFALLLDGEAKLQRFQLAACADVVPKIHSLMEALEQPLGWGPGRRAAVIRQFTDEWGAGLLPPPEALKRFQVLLIVPHHFLHGVPLHLVRFGGETLATTWGVSYCASASLLHRCFERNPARRSDMRAWSFPMDGDAAPPAGPPVRTCLSYGVDVLTGKDTAYRELASAFAGHFPHGVLAGSRDDIKNALDRTPRHPEADPARVSPDVICLACHGHVDALHPERSGLLLSGRVGVVAMRRILVHGNTPLRIQDLPFAEIPLWLEPVGPSDGRHPFEPEMMTTGEMWVGCACDAQLVALFGCSTGSGAVGSNDDSLSLASQWLKIGAASVIANLWEADLEVLTEWSRHFVGHWVRLRQPKAIAAREATRALLADRPALADQLELWGCIALLGDWL